MLAKEAFFDAMEAQGVALTYDDVRLRTAASEVSPQEVDISSQFSKNVDLKVPMVSAAMDTVTESRMAIAMAKMGGLGIVHTAMDIKTQRDEVRRVKLHLNGLIERPITVNGEQTIAEVLEMCDNRKFDFRTFPVVDENERLQGILTQSDIDFSESPSSDTVTSAMTPLAEVTRASKELKIEEAYDMMRTSKRKILPLVDSMGRLDGMYILSDVLRIVRDNPQQYNLDANGRLRVGAAVPTDPEEAIERINAMNGYIDVAVVDTAQGDSKYALLTLKKLKETFSDIDIVIGNVSSGESARQLAEMGADGIKIGQGPGSICTTRIETGIGTPQVSAVYDCVKAVSEFKVPINADGGITNPGDISIAIVAGAHSVMMGSRLAGTKESPGEIELIDGQLMMLYRGMGSASALRDSAGSRIRYSVGNVGKPLAEGVESYIPYKGSVIDALDHYIKALRKSMSYVGAATVEDHRAHTGLVRITNAGIRESHPHDVRVIG